MKFIGPVARSYAPGGNHSIGPSLAAAITNSGAGEEKVASVGPRITFGSPRSTRGLLRKRGWLADGQRWISQWVSGAVEERQVVSGKIGPVLGHRGVILSRSSWTY